MLRRCFPWLLPSAALLASVAMSACGTSSGDDTSYTVPGEDSGLPDQTTPDQSNPETTPPNDAPGVDVIVYPDSQPPPGKTIVYAHNDTKLYSVDPEAASPTLTEIGPFDCIGTSGDPSMTDIAVDKDGKLYGVSATNVYLDMKVQGSGVSCSAGMVAIDPGTVGPDAKFYGLSFAPPTAALGTSETLIGSNSNGDLYVIDKTNGKLTLVGNFGKVPNNDGQGHSYPSANVGKNWELSGDIVFLTNNGSPVGFATLRDCPNPPSSSNCGRVDTLVEIDVTKFAPSQAGGAPIVTKAVRGQVLPAGCSDETCGFGSMYGIAAFKDKVWGFSRKGDVLVINNSTGEGVSKGTPLVTPPSSNGFAGAGVTTLAPVTPPIPK
ncbi:MAG: hypothetical protein HY898_14215 [Deltaproteobacteria bacterium]|nr:hypothetical protein [Deltaproteobacteria bacterium]